MKRTFVFFCLGLTLGLALVVGTPAAVQAKLPTEVVTPYKAYRTAIKENDVEAAMKHARAAWLAAETHLGDHKTTGDLAQNFADVNSKDDLSGQIKAMKRAMELSSFYKDEAPSMHMQRGIKLTQLYEQDKSPGKARRVAEKLIEYGKTTGQERSVFYAEALTIKAGMLSKSRDGEKIKKYANEALEIFSNPSEIYESAYPIFAHLFKGFGHEYEGEILEAALSYQTVMDYVGKLEYGTHPIVGRALGRWSHMRSRLTESDEIDEAREKGLCDCWPYDIDRNESVKPIKRVPPKFPSSALRSSVSGYTIIEFNLDDDGNILDPEIIVSWPPKYYEKSSLASLKRWKYSPRQEGEADRDRTNIITTIRYNIQDHRGNPVY